jgi:hypothetical protein
MRSALDEAEATVWGAESIEEASCTGGVLTSTLASVSVNEDGRDDLVSPISTALPGLGRAVSSEVSAFTGTGGRLFKRSMPWEKSQDRFFPKRDWGQCVPTMSLCVSIRICSFCLTERQSRSLSLCSSAHVPCPSVSQISHGQFIRHGRTCSTCLYHVFEAIFDRPRVIVPFSSPSRLKLKTEMVET